MNSKNSTSLACGLALIAFVMSFFGLYAFNLSNMAVPLLWLLLPIGVLVTVACLILVGWRLLNPGSGPRVPIVVLLSLFVIGVIVAIASPATSLMVFLVLIPFAIPIFILATQVVACISLVGSGVSNRCKRLLIASVVLAIAAWPVASILGSDSYQQSMELPLFAEILCWLVCVTTATFCIGDRGKSCELSSSGAGAPIAAYGKSEILLWTSGAMTWLVVLVYIWGIAVKESG